MFEMVALPNSENGGGEAEGSLMWVINILEMELIPFCLWVSSCYELALIYEYFANINECTSCLGCWLLVVEIYMREVFQFYYFIIFKSPRSVLKM